MRCVYVESKTFKPGIIVKVQTELNRWKISLAPASWLPWWLLANAWKSIQEQGTYLVEIPLVCLQIPAVLWGTVIFLFFFTFVCCSLIFFIYYLFFLSVNVSNPSFSSHNLLSFITLCGNDFHSLTTPYVKKYLLFFVLNMQLNNLI